MLLQSTVLQVPKLESFSIIIKKEEPKEKLYTIVAGDSLTSISKAQSIPVERLWAANTELSDPNLIEPQKALKLPTADEVLTDRPMPVTIQSTLPKSAGTAVIGGSISSGTGTAGNTYYWGQCVWYLKNILPWVQNGWGNASDWKYTSGHTVSATPAVGTIAWAKAYSHVALVTGVGDGTVTISEMNAQGVGVISTRTAPASEFEYIYP